jgi:glycosyltransferase involved in cell wall biosynthesis
VRAVLVSPNPGSNMGGVERFCTLLEQVLRSDGWEVTTVGPQIDVPAPLARAGLQPLISAASATLAARRARGDLVISNGYLGGPTGGPRIHVFHGTMVRHVMAGGSGRRRYRLRQAVSGAVPEALSGRGATVVAVSGSTADELGRLYHQRVDAVIPNGVDTDLFAPGDRQEARSELGLDPEARYALFVGRLERRKGADLLPEACAQAGYALLVAGPEAPPGAVSLGTLRPSRLAVAYRAADCVAFPTRYEACSFVVLEALASGVPLITTTAGWMANFLRACPSYSPLITSPDVASVTASLRALASLDLAQPLADARQLILAENSLHAFGSRWSQLASKVLSQ